MKGSIATRTVRLRLDFNGMKMVKLRGEDIGTRWPGQR